MHRYNNQDHSMMTAIKSIRNILNGENNNIWEVNVEDDYHEEVSTGRDAPIKNDLILKYFKISSLNIPAIKMKIIMIKKSVIIHETSIKFHNIVK